MATTTRTDMTIYYLHGFNSDGGGWKADALQKHFPAATIVSPDLPADPAEVVAILQALIESASGPRVVFGTSLGGFYAYYLSARYNLPAFLFNPSLQPDQTLHRGLGRWRTFRKQRHYDFRASYLLTLRQIREEAQQRLRPERLYFFLSTDDDILDLSGIPAAYPAAAALRWYAHSGHGFDKFEMALKEIKREGWITIHGDAG